LAGRRSRNRAAYSCVRQVGSRGRDVRPR
jgi:hypothetical protein